MFVRCSFFSFLMIALAIMIGCASDDEPMEGIVAPEPEPEVIDPEPEPDWADNTLTIEIGRHETGAQMARKFGKYWNKIYSVNNWTEEDLLRPDFPMAGRQYTIEVAVISMLKAGITKPATIAEIQERYKELGCRPLTMEEAIELRLQFTDQQNVPDDHPMVNFLILPSKAKRDIEFTKEATKDEFHAETIQKWHSMPGSPITPLFVLYRNDRVHGIYNQASRKTVNGTRLYDPFNESRYLKEKGGAHFACVISEK